MLMITNLDDLYVFVTLVDEGSFTAAAKKLLIPKSTLSRRLTQLEAKLGSELLIRTTRSQQLSESGRLLYCSAKEHIEALSHIEENVGSLINQPQGQLNILLPLEFFNRIISSLIAEFVLKYPKIMINCQHYSGEIPEFDPQFDLCFVLHEQLLPPSNWIAKQLLSFSQSIYASVDFDHTGIQKVEDLTRVECIQEQNNQPWLFRDNDKIQAVYVKGKVILSSPEMRQQATQKGVGMCKLPNYVYEQVSDKTSLKEVHLNKHPIAQQLSVLYQSRKIPVKTRLFLDYFQSHLSKLI